MMIEQITSTLHPFGVAVVYMFLGFLTAKASNPQIQRVESQEGLTFNQGNGLFVLIICLWPAFLLITLFGSFMETTNE